MPEKLIIQNFGPIKHVELDLKKVNVLIGDQGTGKSTIAKVLAILLQIGDKDDINKFNRLLEEQSISLFFKKDSYISFVASTHTITIKYDSLIFVDSENTLVKKNEIETRENLDSFVKGAFNLSIYPIKCYIPTERQLVQYIIENPFVCKGR